MKRLSLILTAISAGLSAWGANGSIPTAWSRMGEVPVADRRVVFETDAIGKRLPVLWGFDTAWNDYANMLRGVRHSGRDAVSCARVSFQPWAEIAEKGVLPETLQKNLDARMATVGLIGKKVDIVLNLDGGDNTVKEVYGGYRYEDPDDPWWSPKEYIGDVREQGPKWADLIDATAAAVERHGYRVITASPLNEPDLELNGTPIELFYEIAKSLKDSEAYPRFKDIRISGGNTLNNDEALKWYEYNKEYLDEGNTHQLAGSFDTYAAFFEKVREDGRHATADELHNVMEAMVGAEYGMQTGIWWGTAERARGEFMKASAGERLGYAENRDAWSAASVYRNPEGGIQAFAGCSERQAKPSSFKFVSVDRPFFINGVGPLREYVLNLPGDPDGAYQTEKQRNAEVVYNISTGLDIEPEISGDYRIVNLESRLALGGAGGSLADANDIVVRTPEGGADQVWNVASVPEDQGGDFSYRFIRNIDGETVKSLDDNNWNLEDGGKVISYGFSGSSVQQWALEYAGDNSFRIRNKYSALYLTADDQSAGGAVLQREYADTDRQLWRFIPADAEIEYTAPTVPAELSATVNSASVNLSWSPSTDTQEVTYTIARADGEDGDYDIIARGVKETCFLDNTLAVSDVCRYRVMAEDASGNRSDYSGETAVSLDVPGGGLVAHYRFDDDVADSTENRFNLKAYGTPRYRTGPAEGSRALVLSTSGHCQLPYSAVRGREFSVSMWVRLSALTEGKSLFSTGIDDGRRLSLYTHSDGTLELSAVSEAGAGSLAAAYPGGSDWVHIAISVSDARADLYVNGVAADGDCVGMRGAIPSERVLTYLFADINRTNCMAGSVADLRIYDTALTSDEVRTLISDVTSVDAIGASDALTVAEEYFTPAGVRIPQPAEHGVTIVRTTLSDGSVRTAKTVR